MTLRVTVFGDPERELCLISGCGSRVSSAEAWAETAAQLTDLFGDRITLRYYDLGDRIHRAHFQRLIAGAQARGLDFPLVAINGAVVAGATDDTPYPLTLERIVALIARALDATPTAEPTTP